MALNARGSSGSKKTYLNVYQNEIVLEYDKKEDLESKLTSLGLDVDKIKTRKRTKGKNEGKDVFYFELGSLSGRLTNIEIDDTSFGEMVKITFTDVDEEYVLTLGDVFGRIVKCFVRRLDNLDLNNEVGFGLWSMSAEETENGKSKAGVKMYQDGSNSPEMAPENKIEYSISYDELPEPVKKGRGKAVKWDYSEQEGFIYDTLENYIKENFSSENITKAPAKTSPVTTDFTEEDGHDLPF